MAVLSALAWFFVVVFGFHDKLREVLAAPLGFAVFLTLCTATAWLSRSRPESAFGLLTAIAVAVAVSTAVALFQAPAYHTPSDRPGTNLATSHEQRFTVSDVKSLQKLQPANANIEPSRPALTFTPSQLYKEIDQRRLAGTLSELEGRVIKIRGSVSWIGDADAEGTYGFTINESGYGASNNVMTISGQLPRPVPHQRVVVIGCFAYGYEQALAVLFNARVAE